jgi:hypothetical protein
MPSAKTFKIVLVAVDVRVALAETLWGPRRRRSKRPSDGTGGENRRFRGVAVSSMSAAEATIGTKHRSASRRYGRAPTSNATVSVVIPTLNEASNLPHVLTRIPAMVDEVVLVDGHSVDDTIAVARMVRPDIRVVLQDTRGKGNALACGFAAASCDIIVMLDADGSTDPAEIPRFVDALLDGSDFAKGSRFLPGGGSADITGFRSAGNRMLGSVVNTLFRTHYTDLCYGYNAFWRDCLPHMHVNCDGFEVETLITIRVARARLAVYEVPSHEHERLNGESNLNAVRDGLRILRTIIRERIRPGTDRTDPEAWRPQFAELYALPAEHGPHAVI